MKIICFQSFFIIATMLILGGCQCNDSNIKKAEPAHIKIELTNCPSTKIVVEQVTATDIIAVDSTTTDKKGVAQIRMLPQEEEIILLRFPDSKFIPLIISKKIDFLVRADYENLHASFNVEGNDEAAFLTKYFRRLFQDMAISDSLGKILENAKNTTQFEIVRNKALALFQATFSAHRHFSDSLIFAHPEYLSNLLILNQSIGQKRIYELQKDTAFYFLVDKNLTERIPNNSHVLSFHKTVSDYKRELATQQLATQRLFPGNEAPDFSIPDASGNQVSLSHFSGKIVLLAFWSTKEKGTQVYLEMLKTMYADYKKFGFEIIAISMDSNEQAWKNGIKTQNTTWINVSDLKGVTSPLVKMYNLTGTLPVYYLIDRNGKILVQHPSMSEIDEILYEKAK